MHEESWILSTICFLIIDIYKNYLKSFSQYTFRQNPNYTLNTIVINYEQEIYTVKLGLTDESKNNELFFRFK